jgi:predicted oxidoreductase
MFISQNIICMVPQIELGNGLRLSRIVHGHWRLAGWEVRGQGLLSMIGQLCEMGITTFDHADIYGDYSCEQIFGDALAMKPSMRENIQIVTKCGIKLVSGKFPDRKIKTYDYSFAHIIASAERSLLNFRTDRIDLLLFHRPAPFFNPSEVAAAMEKLHHDGKVLNFGVSNFDPMQFAMLQKHTHFKLATNQVELSPWCLEHFDNGNIDFFMKEKIHPMAWSPLAGGDIFKPADEKGKRLLHELQEVAVEMGGCSIGEAAYAWLLKHPAGIIPVAGSGRIDRIRLAAAATALEMNMEQWYRIYNASRGQELP